MPGLGSSRKGVSRHVRLTNLSTPYIRTSSTAPYLGPKAIQQHRERAQEQFFVSARGKLLSEQRPTLLAYHSTHRAWSSITPDPVRLTR